MNFEFSLTLDGFAVDPAALGGVAGELGQAYDDLNTAFGQVCATSSAGDDGSVFAAPEVVTAWNAFCTAFLNEFDEDVAALSELINRLMTTAQRYTETEAQVTGSIHAVGVR